MYLALEDNYRRLKDRLEKIDAKTLDISRLKLTTSSFGINSGLIDQVNNFMAKNPDTNLVIIDTLERIRDTESDKNIYSCDYRDMTMLREITNKHKLTLLLIHHTRKMYDSDPLNTLSGSTGLVGSVDGVFVLEKKTRISNEAKLTIANRDTEGFCFKLELDTDICKWRFLGNDTGDTPSGTVPDEEKHELLCLMVDDFLKEEWSGTATELCDVLKPINPDADVTPLNIKKKLQSKTVSIFFEDNNITVKFDRERGFMAIYHLTMGIISRGKEKSAVASAAYQAGEKITNDYDGLTHDYTKKKGVIYKSILLPNHAPREYQDRNLLWNSVERVDGARNAQLARAFEISLPVELSTEQNINLMLEYVKKHFVSAGMIADVCVHDKGDGNPHAHIMLTLRPIEPDGRWGAKSKKIYILDDNGERIRLPSGEYKSRKVYTVDWNEQTKAEEWRAAWAQMANAALADNGIKERIDHRSYERQGIDKLPSIHMGVAASSMEKKGIRTERGDINREIAVSNNEIRQLRARIRKAKEFWYAQPIENAPSMVGMMNGIMEGMNLEKRWQRLAGLKVVASVLCFLQENGIRDMKQLAGKVTKINERFYEASNKIKAAERRLDALRKHLTQYEIYRQNKGFYQKYKQLDTKKRDAFYDKHSEEIQSYEAAKQYLDGVMNGRTDIPVKAWQAEQKKLTADRFALCDEFYRLKEEIKSVEVLKRTAIKLMGEVTPDRNTARTQGIEL